MSDFDIDAALMEQAARLFIKATSELAESLPHPGGRPVRISLEVIGGGSLGEVAIDVTNLWALAQYAAAGAAPRTHPARRPRPVRQGEAAPVQGDA
ncbi:hypothetical protein D3C59_37400, partial [Streptomyces sp. SHP22-7]